MALVTIAQAKHHLRLPSDVQEFNADVQMKLEQATALVLHYLKRDDLGSPAEADVSMEEPSGLTAIERAMVQAAILKVLTNLDRYRGDEQQGENPADEMFLTADIRGLLSMLRDPALA